MGKCFAKTLFFRVAVVEISQGGSVSEKGALKNPNPVLLFVFVCGCVGVCACLLLSVPQYPILSCCEEDRWPCWGPTTVSQVLRVGAESFHKIKVSTKYKSRRTSYKLR